MKTTDKRMGTVRKKTVDNSYDACLELYTAIKNKIYVSLDEIANNHKISKSLFATLRREGIIKKQCNGVFTWHNENEEWNYVPLSHDQVKELILIMNHHYKGLLESRAAEQINETVIEHTIEHDVPEQEEVEEVLLIDQSCSPERAEQAYKLMSLLISNKSVELEKAPSTAVSLLDSLYQKLGYEESHN